MSIHPTLTGILTGGGVRIVGSSWNSWLKRQL